MENQMDKNKNQNDYGYDSRYYNNNNDLSGSGRTYHQNNQNMNIAQIPKNIKEKLNLPLKNSTFLKNPESTKSNKNTKTPSKKSFSSNIIKLNSSNRNSFKRSPQMIDSSKNSRIIPNSEINFYTGENNMSYNTNKSPINYMKNKRINLEQNQNKNENNNQNLNQNKSRSKSNGKKNKSYDPMFNLLRTFKTKNEKENPATYRKYRTNTKNSDRFDGSINKTVYPVHLIRNDLIDNTQFPQNENSKYDLDKNNITSPINLQNQRYDPINVNLSKYNDYEYYQHNKKKNQSAYNLDSRIGGIKYPKNEYSNKHINNQSQRNNHDGRKKSSNVLSDILDSHFTIKSPQTQKVFNLAEGGDVHNGDSKIYSAGNFNFNTTSKLNDNNNNHNNNPNISLNNNRTENFSGTDFYKDRIYSEDQNTKMTINLSYVGEHPPDKFLESLEHIMTILDPIFDRLSFNEKLEKFIENTDDHRRSIRLGSLVGIYIFLKKYQVDDDMKIIILEKVLALLQNYEIQEELFLVACLEILGLFAPCDLLFENTNLISMFLTDFNFPKLQKSAFYCLMLMENDGIKALVDLAGKDFRDYTNYILNNLIATPHIQKSVIIRALLNEIYSSNPDKRHAALAALNRMHDLVSDDEILVKLAQFFKDTKIEKVFLASTLRTAGKKGEKYLLNELKMNNEFSVRVAICSVLAYRTLKSPTYLNVRLDKNDTFSIVKTLPGSFCTYFGKISPYVTDKIQEEKKEIKTLSNDNTNLGFSLNEEKEDIGLPYDEYLEVNSRDFLASLQRLVSINYNHQNPKLVHKGNYNNLDDMDVNNSTNDTFSKYMEFFRLEKEENINIGNSYLDNSNQINKKSDGDFSRIKKSINNLSLDNNKYNNNNEDFISDAIENSKNLISNDVIKGICLCLKDYSSAVRETAANSLAHIALPESLVALQSLIESLKDSDVVVKSKVLYAIERIAHGIDSNFIIPHLIEALNTNFWKVKLACMKTLSEFGSRAGKYALPYLQKLLKDSPINKQAIADTIVKLGFEGESILLKFLTTEDDSNFKMKSVIARAFSHTALNSHNLDFIIETLFKTSNSDYSQIRISAITAIRNLMEKSNENNTYLKRKNVIPFFYNKLTDKDFGIQTYAIDCIKYLGPQGELIFIEGLSKDSNPIVRANCAIGLGSIGPHTIRTLLIALHDDNKEVRKIVEKEIVGKFNVEDVLNAFSEKSSQKLSLKIAIRDALEKSQNLQSNTRAYFNELVLNLEHDINNIQNMSNNNHQMDIRNKRENENFNYDSENYNSGELENN